MVRVESFLAVVADDEWAAVRASRELKATWTEWRGLPGHDNLEGYLRDGVVDRDQAIVNRGPSGPLGEGDQAAVALKSALKTAKTTVAATYSGRVRATRRSRRLVPSRTSAPMARRSGPRPK